MSEYGIKPYSKAIVRLLKGVVENSDTTWSELLTYQTEIQNYISTMGLELILKKDEGFAFVKQMTLDGDKTINLVSRRQYGFEVSVMLVVLRQMLEDQVDLVRGQHLRRLLAPVLIGTQNGQNVLRRKAEVLCHIGYLVLVHCSSQIIAPPCVVISAYCLS